LGQEKNVVTYLVHPTHIKSLAVYFVRREFAQLLFESDLPDAERARKAELLASILWSVNCLSVQNTMPDVNVGAQLAARGYSSDVLTLTVAEYQMGPALSPLTVLAICHAIDLHSAKYNAWFVSQAKVMLDNIRLAAVQDLPGFEEALSGVTILDELDTDASKDEITWHG
jgi:hypothetical protein